MGQQSNATKPPVARRWTGDFFVAFLALQILFPIVALTRPRPAHFGWQMFSDWRPMPQYWVVSGDGATREIDIHEHIGVRRLDADYHRAFPAYLCRAYPEAVAVRWQWPGADEIEELPCSR